MTGAFVSKRRADEFDALLSAPTRELDSAAAYAELLEVVGALRATPPVSARPEFVADLRSQLIVEAARQARPVVDDALRLRLTPRQRSGARERRAATLLGGFAIVAASGSMAMASQAALPGDVLYPVKRAIENAHTNLQSDDAAKAETLIAHAEERLQEARELTDAGADAGTVATTLQDFTDQSSQATQLVLDDYAATGDQDSIGNLRTFTAQSMGELDTLGDVVPADARAALITAAQSVLQSDTAAFQVCPTCGDGGVTELPPFAYEPVALELPLLGDDTVGTIAVSPQYLQQVQDAADQTPVRPDRNGGKGQQGNGDGGDDPAVAPTVDPSGDPVVPTDDVTNPLQNLGNHIKDGLTSGGDDDVVDQAIDDVVNGVGGLVDGLLGN